jgi:hypothetical protein
LYVLDRFEGDFAVLIDDNQILNIRRSMLPANAKEGDCIMCKGGQYFIDETETVKRKKQIEKLMNELFE